MIDDSSSLNDICFAVAGALHAAGMTAVLCGGSAAAFYAPQKYVSYDADFVLDEDDDLDDVARALDAIGFKREGRSRIFSHPATRFTVDFPKGPLGIGSDYVRTVNTVVGERSMRPSRSRRPRSMRSTFPPYGNGRYARTLRCSRSSPSSNAALNVSRASLIAFISLHR